MWCKYSYILLVNKYGKSYIDLNNVKLTSEYKVILISKYTEIINKVIIIW